MKKKIMVVIAVGILMTLVISMCGCTELNDYGEKPNCYVTKVNGYWSKQYGAYFVDVSIHNNGGKGNVHIGCDVTQDGQTYSHFWLNTVGAGCDDSQKIRCGDITQNGGMISYKGWVRNA